MFTAIESGDVLLEDGRRYGVIAGVTQWRSDCPELADPAVARLFGRGGMSRGSRSTREVRARTDQAKPSKPEREVERPFWYLAPAGERSPRPVDPEQLERTARHEAAHAAAAFLLGWEVSRVRFDLDHPSRAGHTDVLSPRDLDPKLRETQFATITLAAKEHVGWTYDDVGGSALSYRSDRRQAWRALAGIGGDSRYTGELWDAARAQASRLAKTSEFKMIARAVERELLERGELRGEELVRLMRRAKSSAWNERGRG